MGSAIRLVRPFTASQQKIAAGIVAGLSYGEIGKELGGRSHHTVRQQVIRMSRQIVGLEDLPPRWAVYVFAKFPEWDSNRRTH